MSKRIFGLVIPAVAAIAFLAGPAFPEDPKPTLGAEDPKAFEQEMEALAAPGEMHAWLARFAGEWNVKGAFSEPDGSQMESTGTATIRMVLGGRFQEQVYRGKLKDKVFDGHGLTGYDNLSKQFENFWFDTLGTTPSVARGALSPDRKSLQLAGEWVMPGGQKMAFRFITTWVSDASFTFQIHMDVGGGNLVPVGSLTYTRAAGARAAGATPATPGTPATPAMPAMNDPAAMKEMEKLMEQLATPGEQHRWLAKANGGWRVTGHFLEPDGTKSMVCGTACFRMVQGGRWQEQTLTATMKGKRFEGRGMTGFDNAKQRFENTWFDTMSTSHAPAYGQRSADGKSLTLSGEWEMPGGMKMPFKYVSTYVHDRRMTFQMYMTMEGKEMLMGELVYSR